MMARVLDGFYNRLHSFLALGILLTGEPQCAIGLLEVAVNLTSAL